MVFSFDNPPLPNFDICQNFFGFFFEGFPYEQSKNKISNKRVFFWKIGAIQRTNNIVCLIYPENYLCRAHSPQRLQSYHILPFWVRILQYYMIYIYHSFQHK